MLFSQELRDAAEKYNASKKRKDAIVANIKKRLMEQAKQGKVVYETHTLNCHPEEEQELITIMRKEGVSVTTNLDNDTSRPKLWRFYWGN